VNLDESKFGTSSRSDEVFYYETFSFEAENVSIAMEHKMRFLKDVYFFKDLSQDELRALAESCREERFSKGEILFIEGEKAEKFYIIIDGTVEVWKDYYDRHPDLLAIHGKGHLFGEMALVDDLPRSATVLVKTDANVLSILRDDFHRILQNNSMVALSLLKSLSSMVRKSNDYFVDGLRRQNLELQHAYEDLKAVQEELIKSERMSNLGKFSSLIIHDIRNPISVMKGYAEMILLHGEDSEKRKKYATGILKEVDRLNLLVGELLDYSRGDIRLNLSIVSLHQFFEKLRQNVAEAIEKAGIRLEIRNEITDPIIFDEARMLRVFINLCDNSRKAISEGGEISITARKMEARLVLTVEDTGIGMTREVLDHIFEPFFSTSKQGGTGLGLVIVKNVVEAHDGTVSVQSKVKTGTKVEIVLPFRG